MFFHVSAFGILFLFMACSSKSTVSQGTSELFTPVDCWEVVSIDGKSVQEYFALFGGDLSVMETEIVQNDLCFFQNGTWFWTLEFEIEANMGGGLVLQSQVGLAGKGSYNGSFTPRGGTLVMAQEDLQVQLEPEDFWTSSGITEEDFRNSVTRNWLFGKIENWSARATGPRLTLTNSDGLQQVLMRK